MHDWAEFRHFRYLLAILEKRGFRAAAEELHTSQPNLTVQARQFQDHAGVRLFRKSKAGQIRPTESGSAFVALARHLLQVRDEVIEAITAIERGESISLCCASSSLVDANLFRELCMMQKQFIPSSVIRPTHGDVPHLIEEVRSGVVDIALVTLPASHPDLSVSLLRRNKLVACVRKDSELASKALLSLTDLKRHLKVFYHPQKHPQAHTRLLELLLSVGIEIRDYSRASHPSEIQALVREGFGIALIREGMPLDEQLTTKQIAGVDWTVDTALIHRKEHYQKIVPILVRQFRKQFGEKFEADDLHPVPLLVSAAPPVSNVAALHTNIEPIQLTLIR